MAKALKHPMSLEHYSSKEDLTEVDPAFQGTGVAGKETERPGRIPRSYFYFAGTKPEGIVAGQTRAKYSAVLPPGAKLYDFAEDELNLLEPKWIQTKHGMLYDPPDLDEVEKEIESRGYHGYHNYNSTVPGGVAIFKKLKVSKINDEVKKDEPEWTAESNPDEHIAAIDAAIIDGLPDDDLKWIVKDPYITPEQQGRILSGRLLRPNTAAFVMEGLLSNPALDLAVLKERIIKKDSTGVERVSPPAALGALTWARISKTLMEGATPRIMEGLGIPLTAKAIAQYTRLGMHEWASYASAPLVKTIVKNSIDSSTSLDELTTMNPGGIINAGLHKEWVDKALIIDPKNAVSAISGRLEDYGSGGLLRDPYILDTMIKSSMDNRVPLSAFFINSVLTPEISTEHIRGIWDSVKTHRSGEDFARARLTMISLPNSPDEIKNIAFDPTQYGSLFDPESSSRALFSRMVRNGSLRPEKMAAFIKTVADYDATKEEGQNKYLKDVGAGILRGAVFLLHGEDKAGAKNIASALLSHPSLTLKNKVGILHSSVSTGSSEGFLKMIGDSPVADGLASLITDYNEGLDEYDEDDLKDLRYYVSEEMGDKVDGEYKDFAQRIVQRMASVPANGLGPKPSPAYRATVLRHAFHDATPKEKSDFISKCADSGNFPLVRSCATVGFAKSMEAPALDSVIKKLIAARAEPYQIDECDGALEGIVDRMDSELAPSQVATLSRASRSVASSVSRNLIRFDAETTGDEVRTTESSPSMKEFETGLVNGDYSIGTHEIAALAPHLSLDALKTLAANHSAVGDRIRKFLGASNPDLAAKEQVSVKMGTTKARKFRDLIMKAHLDKRGGTILPENKGKPEGMWATPKEIPNWSKLIEIGRMPNGSVSAGKIQSWIDAQPETKYNVTEGSWTASQRHNSEPSKVFQLNMTKAMLDKLKTEAPEAHATWKKIYNRYKANGHPSGPFGLGWVRWTGDPERGIFIDEVQSDIGQSMVRQEEGGIRRRNMDRVWRDINGGELSNIRRELDLTPLDKWYSSDDGQSMSVAVGYGESRHAGLVRAVAAGKLKPEDFSENDVSQMVEASPRYRAEIAQLHKDYPEEHLNHLTQTLFGGQHSNIMLHEAFQQWMRNKGWEGVKVAVHSVYSKAPHSGWDLDKVVKRVTKKKDKKTGEEKEVANYQLSLPGHARVTYDQHPVDMGFEPAVYGNLPSQDNPHSKTMTIYSVDANTGETKGKETPTPIFQGEVHKSEEWEEILASLPEIVLG